MLSYMITFYYIITKFAQTTELRKFMKETDPQLSPRYEVVEQLKQARKSLNVTQEDLAERVGTKKSNISRFESGRYNPSLDFLIRIADSLGKQLHIKIQ